MSPCQCPKQAQSMTIVFESKRNDKCETWHFQATAPSPIQLHLQVANCTFKLPTAPSINPNRISSNKHKMVQQRKNYPPTENTWSRTEDKSEPPNCRIVNRVETGKSKKERWSKAGFPLKLYFVVFEAVGYSKCVNYIGSVLCHTICALKNN